MTFVRSGGQLVALGDASKAGVRAPVAMYGNTKQAPDVIWRTQPAVRTVIGFLGRNIAQLGLHVFERVSDSDRRRITDSPLAKLIKRPFPQHTWYRLIDALVQDMCIYDEAFLLKVRPEGSTAGLIRLPPGRVTPVGSWVAPTGFSVGEKSKAVVIPAEEVIYFRGYNPTDPLRGVSSMETLRRILAEEVAAGEYREQFWNNAARIEGVLRRPADAPEWSDVARARFIEEFQTLYSGAGNSGRTAILEEGMEFTPTSFNAKDSQFIESRKLSREEVAAAYHVPLPMVGILDHATFSNIKEQHKQLYQDTLGPWTEMIQQEFEAQLVPDLEPSGKVYIEFNISEKMKGSFEEQAASIQSSVGAPVMTRNEGRGLLNLPALDGGNDLITPLNVANSGDATGTEAQKAREIAELLQKAYLAVGPVITADEARTLANLAGADLKGSLPPKPEA